MIAAVELRQLRHFLMVVEHGNFNRAAAALCITQQALSASIARLEEGLNTTLFTRGPNGVALTGYGERLVPRARLICSESRRVEFEMRELQDAQTGTVRIGAGAFFLERLLPAAVAGYVREHPRVEVAVLEGISKELFGMLRQGEIDFSMSTPVAGLEPPFELECEVLFTMPTQVLMRHDHPLSRLSDPTLANLVGWPWIVSEAFDGQRAGLVREFQRAGLPAPTRFLSTDSIPVIRYLLLHDDYLMVSAKAPGDLNVLPAAATRFVDIPELGGEMPALLAWRRTGAMLPAASRFLVHIRQAYRDLAAIRHDDK